MLCLCVRPNQSNGEMQILILCAILQLWFIRVTVGVVPQITKLNVQCDRAGMKVMVDFDVPFNGIIFSKGHFTDPNCRFIQPNSSVPTAEFLIPVEKCGTTTIDIDGEEGSQKRGFENIVVFQNDPTYQEVWDHARMIVCQYSLSEDLDLKEKRIVFKPVVVDMLDVLRIPLADEKGDQQRVDCWMEITRGRFPQTSAIDGPVKVGSPLTLAIFIRDPRKRTDVRVKDCYAYDDPEVAENNGAALLQLTDFDGCPAKPKLIEVWKRTLDTGPTGATVIAFSTVTAFKFPDRADLQLTCNIEICRNQCAQRCQSELPEPVVIGPWNREVEEGGNGVSSPGPVVPQKPDETDEDGEDNESEDEDKEPTSSTTSTTEAPADEDSDDEEEGEAATPARDDENEDSEEKEPTTTTPASADGESDGDDAEGDNDSESDSSEESDDSENEASPTTTTTTTAASRPAEATSESTPEAKDEEEESEDEDNEESSDEEESSESSAKLREKSKNKSTTTTSAPTTARKGKSKSSVKTTPSKSPSISPKAAAIIIKTSETRSNLIEQIHWSTTTLRPPKELMDSKPRNRNAIVPPSRQTTTTTTTTTVAPRRVIKVRKESRKPSTSTTTTTTTTTTTPKPTTTTAKTTAARLAVTKKFSRRTTATKKPATTTTAKSTTSTAKSTAVSPRRARAPSSSHPDEFPHLHIVEDKKRFLATRRPSIFRFKALSLMRSTEAPTLSSLSPPEEEENQISPIAETARQNATTKVTINPLFLRQRLPIRLQYRSFDNKPNNSHTEPIRAQPNLPIVDGLPTLARPAALKSEAIASSSGERRADDYRPAFSFNFHSQRIRKPITRVVRSVMLNSKVGVYRTRLNTGLLVV